ncbi:U3 snoRNP protein [Orbilia ellipsospora]|uniref:U3 snoRNP protein n=1 Tax=Orbilia ellipsospora TaxID=2528407 RepID=A0AAV9X910_9PEZI
MATSLFKTLGSHPLEILRSNRVIYTDSVSHVQHCFDALTENHIGPDKLHTTGFDIDQIWEQTKCFLEAVTTATLLSEKRIRCDFHSLEGPPKKKLRVGSRKPAGLVPCRDSPNITMAETEAKMETQILDRKHPRVRDTKNGFKIERSEYQARFDEVPSLSKPKGSEQASSHDIKSPVKELNDEFFQLDKFNLATKSFERADEVGEAPIGFDLSINWHADLGEDSVNSNSSDSEDPTAHNGPMYTDFFLPPGNLEEALQVQPDTSRPKPYKLARELQDTGFVDGVIGLMEMVRSDLFQGSNEDNLEEDPDSESDEASNKYAAQSSSYKREQIQLNDQIRTLEKQNIEQREWAISGEVGSQRRPFNSLLEEDLDFERIGKPVPIITQTTTTSLEDMIKSRILRNNFDEIQRRSLTSRNEKSSTFLTELDDSKSRNSLAEAYLGIERGVAEELVDDPNSKPNILKVEIRKLFLDVNQQLDTLSSKHFTPKNPNAIISTIPDTRVINFEEINLGAVHSSASGLSALAPQEIYDPSSTEFQSHESAKASGIPISSREIEYSQRIKDVRQRGRDRKPNPNSKTSGLLKTLQRGGVSIIKGDGHRVHVSGIPETGKPTLTSSYVKL